MPTEEELEKAKDEAAANADETDASASSGSSGSSGSPGRADDDLEVRAKADSDADEAGAADHAVGDHPVQLGYQRFVYAAYMAGAMLVAFLVAKIGHTAWYRLGQWKPQIGEPQDEILYPIAAIVGIVVALYYWRKQEARQYANEVAEELSKVTWPSRKEVTNSTTVVVLTTLFATVFFALMDRFWGYVTDQIYSF